MQSHKHYQRYYLLTYPRTASNLLMRILALEDQPNAALCKNGGYFFLPLQLLRYDLGSADIHVSELTPDQKRKEIESTSDCFKEMIHFINKAEASNQIVLVKEHAHYLADPVEKTRFIHGQDGLVNETPWVLDGLNELQPTAEGRSANNKTIFSDDFLRTWKPIFLIRHPALAFPSYYRATVRAEGEQSAKSDRRRKFYQHIMTLQWTRRLYEFYSHDATREACTCCSIWPLVLDGDDIITHPTVVVTLCDIIGLDSKRLKFRWEKDEQQKDHPKVREFKSTINGSTGIDPSKATGRIDIDEEAAKWKADFGDDIGRMIEHYVREAMPDYIYLRSKKLRA